MGPRMRFDHDLHRWVDDRTRLRRIVEDAAETAAEIAVAAMTLAAIVLSFWLYCALTPPQCSAECELQRAEMEAAQCPE